MDDRTTRVLKVVAVIMAVAFVGWAVWDKFIADPAPGDMAYHAGNTLFEDGYYERAAAEYRQALDENPEHIHALRGLARSLHKMVGKLPSEVTGLEELPPPAQLERSGWEGSVCVESDGRISEVHLLAAAVSQDDLPHDAVVSVFPDSSERYLSKGIYRSFEQWEG